MSFGKAMGLLAAGAAGGVGKGWQQKILQDRQAAIEEGRRFFQKEMIQTQHENALERDEKNFERSQSLQPKPPTFGKTEQNPETGTLWQQNLVTGKWSDTGIKFVSEGGGLSKEKVMDTERNMSKDYASASKGFVSQLKNYKQLESSLKANNGAGDIAAVFSFMKSLDDQSVVREGEFAMAEGASGTLSQIKSWYERNKSGNRLTPEQKAQFLGLAQQWLGYAAEAQQSKQANVLTQVENWGLNAENVIGTPYDYDSLINFTPISADYFMPKEEVTIPASLQRPVQTPPSNEGFDFKYAESLVERFK
ncbi:hypothetical protein TW81_02265 [Vibrio galatheae]|uniref:Uncharacterized protein n=1 Tax=Vibrio galatheae TaxID=579748 RepID=A0A0F4NPL6_9VIBR|nr:hypothetical protein [Vibrio galatheae]KJY84839.1 hypothetical protein TW81_02265 [Vibrio galatheae]